MSRDDTPPDAVSDPIDWVVLQLNGLMLGVPNHEVERIDWLGGQGAAHALSAQADEPVYQIDARFRHQTPDPATHPHRVWLQCHGFRFGLMAQRIEIIAATEMRLLPMPALMETPGSVLSGLGLIRDRDLVGLVRAESLAACLIGADDAVCSPPRPLWHDSGAAPHCPASEAYDAEAWVLDCHGLMVAIGADELLEIRRNPIIHPLALAPPGCPGLIIWHGLAVAVLELGEDVPSSEPDSRYILIVRYLLPDGRADYGGLATTHPPHAVRVTRELACQPAGALSPVDQMALAWFQHGETCVPILDLDRLFSAPPEC